jgi:hypothetical protein
MEKELLQQILNELQYIKNKQNQHSQQLNDIKNQVAESTRFINDLSHDVALTATKSDISKINNFNSIKNNPYQLR